MGTTADKLSYLNGTKTAIKNAIVSRGVPIPDGTAFRDYAEKIEEITDIPDLSNPGSASDLRNGKQLVGADGSVITGTLSEVEQATPSISVSSSGLITATAMQNGGIVIEGSKSATEQLTTQAGTTITPGTTIKTACASGRYTTGTIYVAGDSKLIPQNIAKGVTIFGVTGTHVPASETVTVTFPNKMYQVVYVDADGNSTWGEGKTFNVLKGGVIIFDSGAYRITFSPSNAATLVDKQEVDRWRVFRYVYMINDNCTVSS